MNGILTKLEKKQKLKTLQKFYGSIKSSVFQVDDNKAAQLVATTTRQHLAFLWFEITKEKAIKNLNNKKKNLVLQKKLTPEDIDLYKCKSTVTSSKVHHWWLLAESRIKIW